jgi:hypothetical protein
MRTLWGLHFTRYRVNPIQASNLAGVRIFYTSQCILVGGISIETVAMQVLNYPISMGYIILARANRKLDIGLNVRKFYTKT